MKTLILALLLTTSIAKAQTCDQAKADLDKAVASVKLSCFEKASAPSPTPAPVQPPPPVAETWTKCADEGGRCNYSGTRQVRYGITGKYAYKTALGSIGCNNEVFGDPAVGVAKTCAYSSLVSAPSPSPSPIVVQPTPFPAPPISTGKGIFIGTKEFNSLAEAGAAFRDGDTILITKSLVDEATALVNPGKVTVKCLDGVSLTWPSGVNKRLAWGKAILNVEGDTTGITVINCNISGAQIVHSQGGNGSAVRLINGKILEANFINVTFHYNNNGIMGDAAVINIENSRFYNNGAGPDQSGYTHNVYFGSNTNQVNVKDSYFGPVFMGNIYKSRAKSNNIVNSVFESKEDTNSSYLIDIPDGGNVKVTGSVLVKAPKQGQRSILSYATEHLLEDGRTNVYEFANNIVVADAASDFFRTNHFKGAPNMHDNIMVGSFGLQVTQTNTKSYADRSAAGIPAAPAIPKTGFMGTLQRLF